MKRKITAFLTAVCLLLLVCATVGAKGAGLSYVTDRASLLDESEIQYLERMAQTLAREYDVGVYIVTVEDYREYDPAGVYDAAYGIYHDKSLGEGEDRSGILLLLSMAERDYALFRYGETAVYAFSDYALAQLEESFLDELGNNDWADGFEAYILKCAEYLEKAEAGSPVRESPIPGILISWVIALAIAASVCAVMVGRMKSVRKQSTAANYAGNLNLTEQYDQFTHRTETRRKIERNQSSGGGESHSSGRSGKF